MPYNYQAPGVYVEEVSTGARPIESVATSILAIVGFCRDTVKVMKVGQSEPEAHPTPKTPTLVTSWTDFTDRFGDLEQAYQTGFLHQSVAAYFLNGGRQVYIVGVPMVNGADSAAAPTQQRLLMASATLPNANNEAVLKLTTARPIQPGAEIAVEVQPSGEGAPEGAFNLVVTLPGAEPKTIPNLILGRGQRNRGVVDVLTQQTDGWLAAELLGAAGPLAVGHRVTLTVTEAPAAPQTALATKTKITPEMFVGSVAERTGIKGLEAFEDVTMLMCPDVFSAYAHREDTGFSLDDVKTVQKAMIDHCEMMKDRFAILDMPPELDIQGAKDWRLNGAGFDTKYAAMYYPWVTFKARGEEVMLPPSGYVAGVYARVDSERGVHKAPANETLRGVTGLACNVTRNEQEVLNPEGVNCIRAFPGGGIRIWGARTLSKTDKQWTYINVRRLFCNIEDSILQSTNWIVFEPNDRVLWSAIRRDITAYLTVRWREGALFGKTPEEAFYVKCNEDTNPKELRDLGYCVIEVGIAPVKPAEFVVFKIGQWDGGGSTTE
ncbi:MAG: phage tail sheath subtilisin-like domain-containing protein [Anaerolineae bacterium]